MTSPVDLVSESVKPDDLMGSRGVPRVRSNDFPAADGVVAACDRATAGLKQSAMLNMTNVRKNVRAESM
jgi:hypothetical protein